ncbi:helix-turn-helix domain-containing protein [Enterobacter ludwigii]|uniref:helix-turn-helix domain-containing protein n=1 Tax=Enterobacter TaxID=547 RepID=UPI003BEEF1AE
MDIQSAVSECDMAHAILIAMNSYVQNETAGDRVTESLTFAAESCLARALSFIKNDDTAFSDQYSIRGTTTTTQQPTIPQPTESPTSFAAIIERIRSRRVALGLTTEELSTQLGFEIDTVEDWETGCDAPELTILLPLSRALFCEPEWLLTGSLEGMTRINEAPLAPVKVMQGVDMSGVGERIRDARVSRRMTHKELEEAAGLPDGVISVWEFRQAYPPDEAFDKLAKALNTSVIWLLTGREIARES